MELQKRTKLVGLRAMIDSLRGDTFAPEEERALRAELVAEAEALRPTPPPCPRVTVDLCVPRQDLVEDVERCKKKAQPVLDQIARETDSVRILTLQYTNDQYGRYAAAVDRLQRWDINHAYMLWKAAQQELRESACVT